MNKLILTFIVFLFALTAQAQKTIIVDTLICEAHFLHGYNLVDVPIKAIADERPYPTTLLIERPGKHKFREVSTRARTAVIANITDDSIALKLDNYGSRIMLQGLHSIKTDTIRINYMNTTAKTDSIIKGDVVYWHMYNDSMDMSSEWVKSLDKSPEKALQQIKQITLTINNTRHLINATLNYDESQDIKTFHGYKRHKKYIKYSKKKEKNTLNGKVYKYIYFHGEEYKWYYCYKAVLHL